MAKSRNEKSISLSAALDLERKTIRSPIRSLRIQFYPSASADSEARAVIGFRFPRLSWERTQELKRLSEVTLPNAEQAEMWNIRLNMRGAFALQSRETALQLFIALRNLGHELLARNFVDTVSHANIIDSVNDLEERSTAAMRLVAARERRTEGLQRHRETQEIEAARQAEEAAAAKILAEKSWPQITTAIETARNDARIRRLFIRLRAGPDEVIYTVRVLHQSQARSVHETLPRLCAENFAGATITEGHEMLAHNIGVQVYALDGRGKREAVIDEIRAFAGALNEQHYLIDEDYRNLGKKLNALANQAEKHSEAEVPSSAEARDGAENRMKAGKADAHLPRQAM